MPAPGTSFAGPLIVGPRQNTDNAGPSNAGLVVLTQVLTLTQNGANNVSGTFTIPEHCSILGFIVDRRVAFDSATSAGLTIGIAALGTEYASSIDVKAAAGRTQAPVSPTAAQMLAAEDTGTNKSVVATIAVVGATTAGTVTITMQYVQTKNWMSP
jgi:hypothetical protein